MGILLVQVVYLLIRFKYLTLQIPLWYTKPWGEIQLAVKSRIVIIPISTLLIIIAGMAFIYFLRKSYLRYSNEIILTIMTGATLLLTYSALRIVMISSTPFTPLISPIFANLIAPLVAAFLLVYFLTPGFLAFARKKGLVTDPALHDHPGMVLQKPSARGGGAVFVFSLAVTSLFFVKISPQIAGILISAILLALLGLLDDYQNTHIKSRFRFIESPILRLGFLTLTVMALVYFFGIKSDYIGNPLGGIIKFGGAQVISLIFTTLWVVWILNLLSWSNGIDGQYSGIVGITGIIIAILALRFVPLQSGQIELAKLAVILAGAGLGTVVYTWHPSRIMWGFGAMSAGIVIAALSILINSKIATSIIILMVPFLDALVTIGRRIAQKKNPFKGDRGHLHHLLIDRGWSIKKIALFYWGATAAFGIIGIISSENVAVQIALTLGGLVAFGIILLNLRSIIKRREQSQTGLSNPKAVEPETVIGAE